VKLLLGTRNKGKYLEIAQSLVDLPITLTHPEALGIIGDPEEHADTFEENATLKARYYFDASQIQTIADDSGIIVDALKDELGVKTRRWGAGSTATDQEWVDYFLNRMKDEKNRRARFMVIVAFIDTAKNIHLFKGVCEGVITQELSGEYLPGLPLRSCFIPEGFDRTLSQMTMQEELPVNHRYKAMEQLKQHIMSTIA